VLQAFIRIYQGKQFVNHIGRNLGVCHPQGTVLKRRRGIIYAPVCAGRNGQFSKIRIFLKKPEA
jgi:hypothetical protein